MNPPHQPQHPRRRCLSAPVIASRAPGFIDMVSLAVGVLAAGDVIAPAALPVDKPPMPFAGEIHAPVGNKGPGIEKIEKGETCRNAMTEQGARPGGVPVRVGPPDLMADQVHRQVPPDGITQEIGVGLGVIQAAVSQHLEPAPLRTTDMVERTNPCDVGVMSGHVLLVPPFRA